MTTMFASLAGALALVASAAPGMGTFAVRDVRVEVGDGTVIERATVVVRDGKIVGVGPGTLVPAGVEVIEGAGRVLTPGLIQAPSHVGILEVTLEGGTVDLRVAGDAVPAFRAIDAYNPQSIRVPIERAQGLTTAIVAPTGKLLWGQAFAVDLDGALHTQLAASQAAPAAVFASLGKSAVGGEESRAAALMRLAEILDDARALRARGSDFEKASMRALSLSATHLRALWPVQDGKVPLVVQVDRAADILAALHFAHRQKLSLIVMGGAEAWIVARELASAKVPVLLYPSAASPSSFDALRARDDAAKVLREAGVEVVIMACTVDDGTTRLRQEAGIASSYGLARSEALRAITLAPARVFGLAASIGTVAVGKRANLVLWSGDPLEPREHAMAIWIDGVSQSTKTRQSELVERYRAVRSGAAPR